MESIGATSLTDDGEAVERRNRATHCGALPLTLTLPLEGGGDQTKKHQYSNESRAITTGRFCPMLSSNPAAMKLAIRLLPP
jgi:hypothetical protein